MALEDGDADTAIDAARDIIRVQAEIAKLDCAIEIDERAKLELTGLARRLTAGLLDGTRHLPRHGGRDREE
ncbi:MAG: hypothetical protein IT379_30315 [Deltaproteobacteria bacterium]|nr:hypothetical protein [Deltaproteobacteria bacterium]